MPVSDFIKQHGINFTVMRNNEVVGSSLGLKNYDKDKRLDCINFYPGENICANDILIYPDGNKVQVAYIETFYVFGKAESLNAYILPNQIHQQNAAQTIINVGTATNSVIGNNNQVSMSIQEMKSKVASDGGTDKDELSEIIALLEQILDGSETPKKGIFSKFSACMERHSWITGAITSALLAWLTNGQLNI